MQRAAEAVVHLRDGVGASVAALTIYASQQDGSLVVLDEDEARSASEEMVQLMESTAYEYALAPGRYRLQTRMGREVARRSRNPALAHTGTINPGSYVGRLELQILGDDGDVVASGAVEVRAKKLSYRDDFRTMLTELTEEVVDLAFDVRSPTTALVSPAVGTTIESLHQQFAFLRGLIDSREFANAIVQIVTRPHERLEREENPIRMGRGSRLSRASVAQIAMGMRRIPTPAAHPLRARLRTLPEVLEVGVSVQTEDTEENRFVRFVLQAFADFLGKIVERASALRGLEHSRLAAEARRLEAGLQAWLRSRPFASAAALVRLPLESPVLQRREGYREVLKAWLQFDMAARLEWSGADDAYSVEQRNVATLYEYWAYFKLLRSIRRFASFPGIATTLFTVRANGGLLLNLKSGRDISLCGKAAIGGVELDLRFDYNRIFARNSAMGRAGSWTQSMRPDYCLGAWPSSITEEEAIASDRIVYLHFDAKYRIESLRDLFGHGADGADNEELEELDEEQTAGPSTTVKRADLLKMHAYKDAIRRSSGAYVLYPGDVDHSWREYHEILPGIGAFVLRPEHDPTVLEAFIEQSLRQLSKDAARV